MMSYSNRSGEQKLIEYSILEGRLGIVAVAFLTNLLNYYTAKSTALDMLQIALQGFGLSVSAIGLLLGPCPEK